MPSSSSNRRKLLVAVDFGTTFSGVAWMQTEDPQAQSILDEWPSSASTDEKVPTTLKYDDNGSYRWGFRIGPWEPRHEWFKLGLYPELRESDLFRRYPSGTALPRIYGEEECESLIVDYLKALREHADHVLNERYTTAVLRTTPKEYIITVPAVWSIKAQDRTRSCAERAGMGSGNRLHIITEPEAAGIYALKSMPRNTFKIGDTFILCDAGGGTVDLISYTVEAFDPIPQIYEAAPGSGDVCGSSFLNRIFAKYLKSKFRHYPMWNDQYQSDALHSFEIDLKRNFAGEPLSQTYLVPARGLPDNPDLSIRGGLLEITGKEISDVFEPVVREIVKLVKAQLEATRKTVTTVLLAGGFGRNNYLRTRLQEAVGRGISVMKVNNGNTAIMRGALLGALSQSSSPLATIRVNSRKARKHFGTGHYTAFVEGIHNAAKKCPTLRNISIVPTLLSLPINREKDPYTGNDRIRVMTWFLKKGTTVRESNPVTLKFYVDQPVSSRPLVLPLAVYACEDPTNVGPPDYMDESVVSKVVELRADLRSIPQETLNKERGKDGKLYFVVDFEFEMTCHPADITFALVYNEKRYSIVREFL